MKAIGIDAAILLSDLCDRADYYEQWRQSDSSIMEDGWFYATAEDIEGTTTLSRHKQVQALKVLQEAGIIETDVRGMPAKQHFKIIENKFSNFLKTCIEKISNNTISNNLYLKTKSNKRRQKPAPGPEFFDGPNPGETGQEGITPAPGPGNGLKTPKNDLSWDLETHPTPIIPIKKEAAPESKAHILKKHHKTCIDAWFLWYREKYGVKPSITAKEAKAMQLLLSQLWSLSEDKSQIVYIFETILTRFDELPRWYASNCTLSIINSKLNEILNCLKNGHQENRRNGTYHTGAADNGAAIHSAFNQFYSNGQHD